MTPYLPTLLCLLVSAYLFWVDRRQAEGVSGAVWIPLLWMFLAGSRYASQWLALGPPDFVSAEAYDEGSPLNRNVFLGLILAGVAVLGQRRVDWSAVLTRNSWLFLFFLFAATSVLWADDTFLSFKRLLKGFGNVVMALIILTDKHPYRALGLILRRLAYVLLPLSVLFIRYYPDLGRVYNHAGELMYTGAAYSKNALGQLCLLVGVYFGWVLLFRRTKAVSSEGWVPAPVGLIVLPMLLWLLYVSRSATSLAALLGAICFLVAAQLRFFSQRPRRILGAALLAGVAIGFLEYAFEVKASVFRALGREADLTGRIPLWEMLLEVMPNPLIGTGYESFWSGDRLTMIWERMGVAGTIQAHNGYIETYLNLGIIGLSLLVIAILSGLVKAQRQLEREYAHAVLKIALILVALAYNYTEAAFKPVNNVFVLLLFGILQAGRVRGADRKPASAVRAPTFASARPDGRPGLREGRGSSDRDRWVKL